MSVYYFMCALYCSKQNKDMKKKTDGEGVGEVKMANEDTVSFVKYKHGGQ